MYWKSISCNIGRWTTFKATFCCAKSFKISCYWDEIRKAHENLGMWDNIHNEPEKVVWKNGAFQKHSSNWRNWKRWLFVFVWTENILRKEVFENDASLYWKSMSCNIERWTTFKVTFCLQNLRAWSIAMSCYWAWKLEIRTRVSACETTTTTRRKLYEKTELSENTLQTEGLRFRVNEKDGGFENDDVMIITWFAWPSFPQTNPKWPAIVA